MVHSQCAVQTRPAIGVGRPSAEPRERGDELGALCQMVWGDRADEGQTESRGKKIRGVRMEGVRLVRRAGSRAAPPLSRCCRRHTPGVHVDGAGSQRIAAARRAAQYSSTCFPWPCFSLAMRSRRCRRREAT